MDQKIKSVYLQVDPIRRLYEYAELIGHPMTLAGNIRKHETVQQRCGSHRCDGSMNYKKLGDEIHKVIVGQEEVVCWYWMSILSNGHSLLVGVPGLAKTLLIKTIADVLELNFKRIQFTPDLMPSDITGNGDPLDEHPQLQIPKGSALRPHHPWPIRSTVHRQDPGRSAEAMQGTQCDRGVVKYTLLPLLLRTGCPEPY